MSPTREQVEAGQAVYSQQTLRIYDLLVLGISNRWLWKCPTRELLAIYDQNVSSNHLDVGVGTGYFLDHCRFPTASPRVALLDMNANCLAAAAARIERYSPEQFTANILEPLQIKATKFDSIGLNYVLHCLPGTMQEKSVALDHLKKLLNPGGVLFGSTLLQGGLRRSWAARRLMNFYNRRHIFSNTADDVAGLEQVLGERFAAVDLHVIGCAAMFVCRS